MELDDGWAAWPRPFGAPLKRGGKMRVAGWLCNLVARGWGLCYSIVGCFFGHYSTYST
jgi:hypothetical protein